jgi:GT2 family glycosyltransferase
MVYIILPVHDRFYKTKEFIDCLLQQSYSNFHLILVDDGSTDGTAQEVSKLLPNQLTVLSGKGNWWWGGSLHQGYLWIKKNVVSAEGHHVLIMNNDTSFEPDFIAEGITEIDKKDKALLTAYAYNQISKIIIDKGTHVNWDKFQFSAAQHDADINCLSTRGLIMKMSTFKSLGGFYPILLPHYLSDYEYTIRAFQKGYTLFTSPVFKLYVDETTTGIDSPDQGGFLKRLKSLLNM